MNIIKKIKKKLTHTKYYIMVQLINQILAFFFDKLKASSPVVATVILAILAGLYAIANALPASVLPDWGQNVIEWIIIVYAAVSGTRTSRFIGDKKVEETDEPLGV